MAHCRLVRRLRRLPAGGVPRVPGGSRPRRRPGPSAAAWSKHRSGTFLREFTRSPRVLPPSWGDGCWPVTHPWASRALASPCRDGEAARRGRSRLTPEEGQQVGVELVLMGGGEAVRRARIVDLLRVLDEPG